MNKKNFIISILLVILAAIAGWFVTKYYLSINIEKTADIKPEKPQQTLDIRPDGRYAMVVKIFYPSENEIQLKEKKIYTNFLPINIAEEVIKGYLQELQGDIVNTRLLGVYRDKDNIIYIDLSDDIRRHFSSDAKFEYNLLQSLLKTVLINVPDSQDVKLLIEGKEIETIGGHFYCIFPLKASVPF